MLPNWILLLSLGLLIFMAGMLCGARLVYRFRHVTTKAVHQALLNSYFYRTRELDRLTQALSHFEERRTNGPNVKIYHLESQPHPIAAAMARSQKPARPIRPRLYRP